MKHSMTLLALVVAVTAGAQGTTIHEYPWNPDWNNDNFVGSSDLTGFLSAFGSEFGNPPEPCDYDGTSFEQWWSSAISGEIIIDSLFIEFQLLDSNEVFQPGCPEPIMEVAEVSWSGMLESLGLMNSPFGNGQGPGFWNNGNSGAHFWIFNYHGLTGEYSIISTCGILNQTGYAGDGLFGGTGNWSIAPGVGLPFPEDWYLDEDGIHIESGWSENNWQYYANYLHILPYWHYAE